MLLQIFLLLVSEREEFHTVQRASRRKTAPEHGGLTASPGYRPAAWFAQGGAGRASCLLRRPVPLTPACTPRMNSLLALGASRPLLASDIPVTIEMDSAAECHARFLREWEKNDLEALRARKPSERSVKAIVGAARRFVGAAALRSALYYALANVRTTPSSPTPTPSCTRARARNALLRHTRRSWGSCRRSSSRRWWRTSRVRPPTPTRRCGLSWQVRRDAQRPMPQ